MLSNEIIVVYVNHAMAEKICSRNDKNKNKNVVQPTVSIELFINLSHDWSNDEVADLKIAVSTCG
jgi:hypothetical protein